MRVLAERYVGRGRAYLDLSVMHDNAGRHPRCTASSASPGSRRSASSARTRSTPRCSPPARRGWRTSTPTRAIIAEEALRRGIRVEVTDAESGEMRLSVGGRTVLTLESLSEFTTAVALSRCDDKRVTRRIMERAGVRVARGRRGLRGRPRPPRARCWPRSASVVVKPARGEQGRGITVGVRDDAGLERAVALAAAVLPRRPGRGAGRRATTCG